MNNSISQKHEVCEIFRNEIKLNDHYRKRKARK